jgi:EAL domain-containing protein (putative c-di-GMP-specific phosphodiesterase class I)
LNKLGIGLGIANFGGLSTLLHNLADLPIQRLSLSDSLLQRDEAEPCCQQNTIGPLFLIAQHYQLTVTLQGINTHACYQLAQELGYTYIQGDIFLPPLSCEELISGLDTKQTISPLIN